MSKHRNKRARVQRRRARVNNSRNRTAPRAPRGPVRTVNVARPLNLPDSHRAYRVAIRNPFHPDAIGARVPDSYSYPTVCYHINTTFSATPNAQGNLEAVFLPTPTCTAIYGQGALTGGTAFANNSTFLYMVSPQTLYQQMTSFRVVAWGLRIILKDTQTNTRGRFYAAVIPTPRSGATWPFYNNITAISIPVISQNVVGYAVGGTVPTAVQSLASCTMFSAQDMIESGSRVISVSPSHCSQYEFRGLYDNGTSTWNANTSAFDAGGMTNVGVGTNGSFHDPVSLAGGAACILYASGLEDGNVFDVDVVYHLEGTPNVLSISGSTTTTIAPSSQDVVVGSTQTVERELAAARNSGQSDRFRPDPGIGTRAFQYVRSAGDMAYSAVTSNTGRRVLAGGLNMYLQSRRTRPEAIRY